MQRSVVAVVAVVAGCGRVGFEPVGAVALGDYGHRKEIALRPPLTSALSSFVVSIAEASDPDLAAAARADGRDLVFTSADDQVLPFEIAGYDPTTGALDAWVQVPSLDGATTVVLYYGGPPAAIEPSSTWRAGVAGVWHMTDGAFLRDSTGHNDLPVPMPSLQPVVTDGIAGRGLRYDGVDDSSSVQPMSADLEFGTASFSYSCWVFVTQSSGQYDMPIYHGGSSASMPGYDMELGTTNWSGHISDGSRTVSPQFGAEPQLLNRWVHLVAVVDRTRGSMNLYTDGQPADAKSITAIGSVDATEPFDIGQPNFVFHGVLDEVRIYRSALGPDWIATEYANLADRATFVSIGPDEPAP